MCRQGNAIGEEEMKMGCSSLAVRGMQVKTAMWCHVTPDKVRKLGAAVCWSRCKDWWTSVILAGTWWFIKRPLTLSLANPAPGSPSE